MWARRVYKALISIGRRELLINDVVKIRNLGEIKQELQNLQCPDFGKIIHITFLKRYRGTQQAGLLE